jgi:glycosyltransferase involved in cell wall biosynthesis
MESPLPHVSILTPVYNGDRYLRECIESVVSQTYGCWDYTIIDNASTDATLEIANSYAANDQRIRVVSNTRHVGVIENHNIAFRHIAPESAYTKVVSADDWLCPDAIASLVSIGEEDSSVGIVQGYVTSKKGVRWTGLAEDKNIVDGRQAARHYLLGKLAFAAPSGLLYRSDLVRTSVPFFPGSNPTADAAACLRSLRTWNLGVVHRVLSYERIHDDAVTARAVKLGRHLPDRLELVCTFGTVFLEAQEFQARLLDILDEYYLLLATEAVHLREADFWKYHTGRMKELGFPIEKRRLAKAVGMKIVDLICEPSATVVKLKRRLSKAA